MSNVGNVDAALTTWEEFLQLPDTENGTHYELHDGEVVAVPPPKPNHIFIQSVLVEWLTNTAQGRGRAASEFPYRPAPNLQGSQRVIVMAKCVSASVNCTNRRSRPG
jgi:hypothetical protein